mgnify:CR=1 FL=1
MKVLIHSSNVTLSKKARQFIQRKISSTLQRFDSGVKQVDLYLKDVNGPKGGIDKECTINIQADDRKQVVVSGKAGSIFSVVKQCAVKAKLLLAKRTKRKTAQRRKPIALAYDDGLTT